MSYRIQFTVSEEQYDNLQNQCDREGYPTIGEMVKSKVFSGNPTYNDLYKEMAKKIKDLDPNQIINPTLNKGEFYLKDIISNPPTILGRYLYERVKDGKISDVIPLGRIGENPNKYKKIGE